MKLSSYQIMQKLPASTKNIFNLVSFNPVGFKIPNYPIQNCMICRGYLTEPCSICFDNKCEDCNVINTNDDKYYHEHCYNFINTSNNKNEKNKNKKNIDDSDSEDE